MPTIDEILGVAPSSPVSGDILSGIGASGGNCCAPIEQGQERQEKVKEPGKYFLGIKVGEVDPPPICNGLV